MYVQGRMKTSSHLVVGQAFDEACEREALNRIRQTRKPITKQILRSTLANLVRFLTRNPNEPRVRKVVDRMDNTTWQVYDPQSLQSLTFDQEADVRQWLEQRYYQPIAG